MNETVLRELVDGIDVLIVKARALEEAALKTLPRKTKIAAEVGFIKGRTRGIRHVGEDIVAKLRHAG